MNPFPSLRATQLRAAIASCEDSALGCAREAREYERLAAQLRERGDQRSAALVRAAAHAEASAAGWIRDADALRIELDRLPRA